MDENMMIHRGGGLVDLIANRTPTFTDWTNDPTDGADITDNDITTFCTTGNKVAGAGYQYAHFDWDLGGIYNVLCGGVGSIVVDAGTRQMYIHFWDGAAWIRAAEVSSSSATIRSITTFAGAASKVRLSVASSVAATITPDIREFHAWRL